MKKLLAIVLSAVLVLAFAAITMAEIKTTGEANFGLQIAPDGSQCQFSDAKLVFDAAVSDTVSVNAAVKTSDGVGTAFFDTYSLSSKLGNGTLKLGYFGSNFNGTTDILTKVIDDLKGPNNIQYTADFSDAISARIQYGYAGSDPASYQVGVKWASDAIAVEVGIDYDGVTELSSNALNFTYTMDALKAYLNYETTPDTEAKDEIVGVLYTAGDLTARFEYNVEKWTDGGEEFSPMGLYLGYKVDAITYSFLYVKEAVDAAMKIKANVKF